VKSTRAEIRAKFHKIPRIRFEAEQRLTSYSGLVVFQALFQRLDFKNRLRGCFDHLVEEAHAIYETATVVLLLVVHLLLGFVVLVAWITTDTTPWLRGYGGFCACPTLPRFQERLPF